MNMEKIIVVPYWTGPGSDKLPRILMVENNHHPEGVTSQIIQQAGQACTSWSGFCRGGNIKPSLLPLRTPEEVELVMGEDKYIRFRMYVDITSMVAGDMDWLNDLADSKVLPGELLNYGMTNISYCGCGWCPYENNEGFGRLLVEVCGSVEECLQNWKDNQEDKEGE